MKKSIKSLTNKVRNLPVIADRKLFKLRRCSEVMKDSKGLSTTVEVIGIALIVLVFLIIIFFPQIKTLFTETIMPAFSNKITSLLNLT